jgi:hypothetical protein
MGEVVRSANFPQSGALMKDHVKHVRSVLIAPTTRSIKVNVEVGNGAIAPKVAIHRFKGKAPVKVEVGNGAIAPKVAIHRRKSF